MVLQSVNSQTEKLVLFLTRWSSRVDESLMFLASRQSLLGRWRLIATSQELVDGLHLKIFKFQLLHGSSRERKGEREREGGRKREKEGERKKK